MEMAAAIHRWPSSLSDAKCEEPTFPPVRVPLARAFPETVTPESCDFLAWTEDRYRQ